MLPEYEIHDGIKIPVLGRKKGSDSTDSCPYCGKNHIHGKQEGHRLGHCTPTIKRGKIISDVKGFYASDNSYFEPEVGYMIREY